MANDRLFMKCLACGVEKVASKLSPGIGWRGLTNSIDDFVNEHGDWYHRSERPDDAPPLEDKENWITFAYENGKVPDIEWKQ